MPVRGVRRRYLAFRIDSELKPEKETVEAMIKDAVLSLFGISGLSKMDLNLIDYDVASCVGTIRCLHTQLRSLRASLAYITNIDGKESAVRVVDASGSIRGLRKRRSSTDNPSLLGEHKS